MPGLLRGVARTAVIAGTATAVSGRVQRRQAARYVDKDAELAAQRDQAYDQQMAPPPAYAPPPPPPEPAGPSALEELKTLGELKAAGVLTDDEFEREKAKILNR